MSVAVYAVFMIIYLYINCQTENAEFKNIRERLKLELDALQEKIGSISGLLAEYVNMYIHTVKPNENDILA